MKTLHIFYKGHKPSYIIGFVAVSFCKAINKKSAQRVLAPHGFEFSYLMIICKYFENNVTISVDKLEKSKPIRSYKSIYIAEKKKSI